MCSIRIKASRQTVAKSLHGNLDEALLFCLKTALETYRFSENKIQDCDKRIENQLEAFEIRTTLPNATRKRRFQEVRLAGLDSRYRGSQRRTRTAQTEARILEATRQRSY